MQPQDTPTKRYGICLPGKRHPFASVLFDALRQKQGGLALCSAAHVPGCCCAQNVATMMEDLKAYATSVGFTAAVLVRCCDPSSVFSSV